MSIQAISGLGGVGQIYNGFQANAYHGKKLTNTFNNAYSMGVKYEKVGENSFKTIFLNGTTFPKNQNNNPEISNIDQSQKLIEKHINDSHIINVKM